MIPGIVFDYISAESYMPFFIAAGTIGILTAIIALFASQPRHSQADTTE